MASEFDKEMDFLLRQTAQNKDFAFTNVVADEHLDADDIIAFAENAVPPSARGRFVAHFAECNDCRTHLSNLILLQEKEEPFVAEQTVVQIAKPSRQTAFWQKLFSFPTLGYATAALALLLIGSFAWIALRPIDESRSVAIVDRIEQARPAEQEQSAAAKVAAPVQEEEPQSATTPETTPAITQENPLTATVAAPNPDANANAGEPTSYRATANPNNNRNESSSNVSARSSSSQTQATNSAVSSNPNTNSSGGSRLRSNNQVAVTESRAAARAAGSTADRSAEAKRSEPIESESSAAADSIFVPRASAAEMPRDLRFVDDKKFQKTNGVWQDSAYKTQTARTVLRSSKEYKKLDSGLRQLAERFKNEEVLIVWQGKAYRIR